jgi:spore maturation protein CgeB
MFCHSLLSDWNHGNAHFLRGVACELTDRGIEVKIYEPRDAWSLQNLRSDYGDEPLARFRQAYPALDITQYNPRRFDPQKAVQDADLVIVHEWNDPEIVARIGQHRLYRGNYRLLFHDTHHRSVTDPAAMSRYDLEHYDGVLAFGESVADVYRRNGWADRTWVWHEAADTRRFYPMEAVKEGDLIWIGNWGDEERTSELHEFLFQPVKSLGLKAVVYGVRYPEQGVAALRDCGIEYRGWTANFDVPQLFARYRVTVHVPRRPYTSALRGVPTIRVFEALACGIPLISAPWEDSEHLFTPGQDFLVARDGAEMMELLGSVLDEPEFARSVGGQGLQAVRARHTCAHRVDDLLDIYMELRGLELTHAGAEGVTN